MTSTPHPPPPPPTDPWDGQMFVKHAPTRKWPRVGDVIGMEIEGRGWVLGRVVVTDAVSSFFPGEPKNKIILYVFKRVVERPAAPECLPVSELLVPPFIVDRQLWTQGYAQTLGNRGFLPHEKYDMHSFGESGIFIMNEYGEILNAAVAPLGVPGLAMPGAVFSDVCQALYGTQ